MTQTQRFASTIALGVLCTGYAMAQMTGGGMPGATSPNMMGGQTGSQMMGGQMMKAEMMRGMVGTMTQMHQMMEKMAGTMDQGQGMDMKAVADMSKMMDDMAGMMKNMAARMRDGHMDAAMLKKMNDRLEVMGKSMPTMESKPTTKP